MKVVYNHLILTRLNRFKKKKASVEKINYINIHYVTKSKSGKIITQDCNKSVLESCFQTAPQKGLSTL